MCGSLKRGRLLPYVPTSSPLRMQFLSHIYEHCDKYLSRWVPSSIQVGNDTDSVYTSLNTKVHQNHNPHSPTHITMNQHSGCQTIITDHVML